MSAVNALSVPAKQQLTAQLLAYIRNHPADFTESQVATATAEKGYADTLALTSGYTETTLMDELETGFMRVVGTPLVNIGKGVSDAVNVSGLVIPAVVLVVIGISIFAFFKKSTT